MNSSKHGLIGIGGWMTSDAGLGRAVRAAMVAMKVAATGASGSGTGRALAKATERSRRRPYKTNR